MSEWIYSTSSPQGEGRKPVVRQGKSMPELDLSMFTWVCQEGHSDRVERDSELEAECYELDVEEIRISWQECPKCQFMDEMYAFFSSYDR
jgi:hypothetical protein